MRFSASMAFSFLRAKVAAMKAIAIQKYQIDSRSFRKVTERYREAIDDK